MSTSVKFRIVLLAVLVTASSLSWRIALARNAEARVVFLNVGQGDAIFIELPDGTQILIDGGPDARVLSQLSLVMAPWDRDLDVVVATHPDADHIGGLPDVLARYDVSMIVETGVRKETSLSAAFENAVISEGARVVIADQPKRIRFQDTAALDVLWPRTSLVGQTSASVNEYAIVTMLRYGKTSFLFPADIERWTEGELLQSGTPLDADVLKVAHHGSKTSSSESFLSAVTPDLAVISVGKENRYGHPTPVVLERLAYFGIPVLRTDEDGSVEIVSDGESIRVVR